MNLQTHVVTKSVSPKETVSKVKSTLENIGVVPQELVKNSAGSNLLSITIGIPELGMFTHGKGVTEDFAVASAYSEFLERLQNFTIPRGIRHHIRFPDEQLISHVPSEQILSVLASLITKSSMAHLNRVYRLLIDNQMKAVPFVKVTDKSNKILVPYEVFLNAVGSNGMCAGNSYSEAITQGVCEVFERFVLKQIYSGNAAYPSVPYKIVEQSSSWTIVQQMQKCGYNIIVKDCSMNGVIPVVGIVVTKGNRLTFKLGASPNFEIALQRCFTELFQGVSDMDTLYNKKMTFPDENYIDDEAYFSHLNARKKFQYIKALRDGTGISSSVLMSDAGEFRVDNLFNATDLTSDTTMNLMIECANNLGYEVYIRDMSFLGFPTYHVYIPGMSECIDVDYNTLEFQFCRKTKFCYMLNDLDTCSITDLEYLIETIDIISQYPYLTSKLNNIILNYKNHNTLSSRHKLRMLQFLLYVKKGDYNEASMLLKKMLETKVLNSSDIDYFMCASKILDMRGFGHTREHIIQALVADYSIHTVLVVDRFITDGLNITFSDSNVCDIANSNLYTSLVKSLNSRVSVHNFQLGSTKLV